MVFMPSTVDLGMLVTSKVQFPMLNYELKFIDQAIQSIKANVRICSWCPISAMPQAL